MNNTCILCPQFFDWYSILYYSWCTTSTDIVKWNKKELWKFWKRNDYEKKKKKGGEGSREKRGDEIHAPSACGLWLETMIYSTGVEYANHYTTDDHDLQYWRRVRQPLHHRWPWSTVLEASTPTITPPMTMIYSTGGEYANHYTTDVVYLDELHILKVVFASVLFKRDTLLQRLKRAQTL